MNKCIMVKQIGDVFVEFKINKFKWTRMRQKERRNYEQKKIKKALKKGKIVEEPFWVALNRKESNEKINDESEEESASFEDTNMNDAHTENNIITEKQECPLCFDEITIDKFWVNNECDHKFCCQCFKHYLESEINERKVLNITCPGTNCQRIMSNKEIKQLLESRELYNKYDQFILEDFLLKDNHFVFCPTPNCGNGMIIMDGNKITCQNCHFIFCLHCKNKYHEGQTCEDNKLQNDEQRKTNLKIRKLIQKDKAKFCLECNTLVLKNKGCNHMTCTCGFEFCWRCHDKYSKRHDKCMFK